MKKVLTIAGSDSGGCAGIQADIKTFCAHGVFGASAITAITAQNTQGVRAIEDISPDIIKSQIDAVLEDIGSDAVKIGMLSRIQTIEAVSFSIKKHSPANVVLDPVMVSTSGHDLLSTDAKESLLKLLFPMAHLITPNIPEAECLTGIHIEDMSGMEKAARRIFESCGCSVLVKGGHSVSDAIDVLYDGKSFSRFASRRIDTKNTHGTGCTLSSAIAANLALGHTLEESVKRAKEYITLAIEQSLDIGNGCGPVNHMCELR